MANPPAQRRTQAERTAATRAVLLEATVGCLVSLGFGRTTTSEVAHRAGVSPGALLHHFPTKADLLCAAAGHLFEMRKAEFRKGMANLEPGADRVAAGIDLLWSMFSGPAFVAWLELWVAARSDPPLAAAVVRLDREFMSSSEAIFRELFADEAAAQPGLARVGVGLVYALMGGLALSRLIPGYEPAPAAEVIAAYTALLRTAMSAPEGDDRHGDPDTDTRAPETTTTSNTAADPDRAWRSLLDRLNRQSVIRQLHPLLERIMRIHVTEEARHLSFARHYLMRTVPGLSRIRRVRLAVAAPLILGAMAQMMLKPSRQLIARYQIPRPVIAQAYTRNPVHRAQAAASLAKVRTLCTQLGLTRAPYHALWRLLRLDAPGTGH